MMVRIEARFLIPLCAIRSLITTSDLVIVSLVVEDSALTLIRSPLFVSSGTRVWGKFWEMIGQMLEETLGVTTEETIGEIIEAMIGEMTEAMIGEMTEAMIGEMIEAMVGGMIRIVSNDARNAVSEN
jgi:hypothetical protein